MKILYIAQERPAALVAAQVLRRIAPDARLTWAPGPAAALGWIRDNRDAGAVIVDAGIEKPGCNALLEQIRALGVDTGVMVVALERLQAMSAALDANAARQQAQHDGVLARTTRISSALQERLLELEEAVHLADERHAAQSAAAADLTRREAELSAALAEAVAVRSAIEMKLADAEAARAHAAQHAAKELAAADERCASIDRRLDRETTVRAQLEARLAAAGLALDEANQRHAAEVASQTRSLADRDAQHDVSLARVNRICTALQERLLELEAAMRTASERQGADTATVARLTCRVAELNAAAEDVLAARTAFERQVAEAQSRYQRAASEQAAASGRCAALEQQLHEHATATAILEQRLAAAQSARQDAAHRHAAELAALSSQVADLQARWGAAASVNAELERQLQDRSAALESARRERESQVAALTGQLTRHETEARAAVAEVVATRTEVEGRLSETERTLQQAVRRADTEREAASARYADLEQRLGQESGARTSVEAQLATAQRTSHDAHQRHSRELAALSQRLAGVQAQHDAAVGQGMMFAEQLRQESGARTSLEARLAEAQRASEEAAGQYSSELAALSARLADVQAQHDAAINQGAALAGQLGHEVGMRTSLEGQLAEGQRASEEAAARYSSELAALTARLADLQTQHDAAIGQGAALAEQLRHDIGTRTSLEGQLAESQRASEEAAARYSSELAALTARLADLQTQQDAAINQGAALAEQLRQEVRTRTSLEAQLAEARHASEEAAGRYSSDLAASSARLAGVQAQHDEAVSERAALAEQLRQEIGARAALDARLTAADSARNAADRHHSTEVAALGARLADVEAQYAEVLAEGVALKQQLTVSAAAFEQAQREWQADVTSAAGRLALREAELTGALKDATAARVALEARLAEAEAAYRAADQRARNDRTAAAERHASLEAQLELRAGEIAGLQREADAFRLQLEAIRTRADALRRHGKQVGMLQLQLDKSRKDNRRLFERAPYGLWECARDGSVIRVNHSLARLLGHPTSADVDANHFVATVFESAADLRWLLERALQTGKMESVETTFKTRDLRRVSVRLHAHTRDESIVIAVEDLTRLQEVEQRLREAERLEAVGRVASEVAETCDTLLRDVSQGGRQWLAGFESDTRLRQQGERLLGDVTRAAGFLRQFVAYGHQQISNGSSVNLPHVLRDMAPILKRVLGDDVTLVLPKTVERFEIDVDAERVERIFVNVANCARERMPKGGRMKIQLATTVVDQQFLTSHPRVRPGAHVLITITEIRGAIWPALPVRRPSNRAAFVGVPRTASERPGMDLGPLLALIGDAGGHLWMSAEAEGNVTLQIRLPQRPQAEIMATAAAGAASNRGRQLARWFRH